MEIKLADNSKFTLTRLAADRLRLDLYQPKTLRDGHSYTLCGTATLSRQALVDWAASAEPKERDKGNTNLLWYPFFRERGVGFDRGNSYPRSLV